MYFISKPQPIIPSENKTLNELFLNDSQKKETILKFAKIKKQGKILPICVDHAGGDQYGFIVPKDKIVGKVNDLILNKNGELIASSELFKNTISKTLVQDMMLNNKIKWGVSVWIDIDSKNNKKALTHLAITKDPGLGQYGSYIYQFSHDKDIIDRELYKHYDTPSPPSDTSKSVSSGFIPPYLEEKWKKYETIKGGMNL
jgi:hypothetical protein